MPRFRLHELVVATAMLTGCSTDETQGDVDEPGPVPTPVSPADAAQRIQADGQTYTASGPATLKLIPSEGNLFVSGIVADGRWTLDARFDLSDLADGSASASMAAKEHEQLAVATVTVYKGNQVAHSSDGVVNFEVAGGNGTTSGASTEMFNSVFDGDFTIECLAPVTEPDPRTGGIVPTDGGVLILSLDKDLSSEFCSGYRTLL